MSQAIESTISGNTSGDHTINALPLRHNFAWTTFGNIVYSFSSWLMVTVIAKLGNPAMVGEFSLGTAVMQPIMMLTALNLSSIQATDVTKRYHFGDYLGLRLITNLVAIAVAVGACVFGRYQLSATLVILITCIGVVFDAVSDCVYGLLRQHERMDRIAVSMAIKGPLSLIGVVAGLLLFHNIVYAAAGSALASALVVGCYDLPSAVMTLRGSGHSSNSLQQFGRLFMPRAEFNGETLKRLAMMSLPMGVVMMLVGLNINLPRYFIEKQLGEHSLGIFSALASFVAVGRIVVTALGMSATPRLARHWSGNESQQFTSLALKLILLGAFVGTTASVAALLVGRTVVSIFLKPEYANFNGVLVMLLAAGGVSYIAMFLGFAMTAAQAFTVQAPIMVITTLSALIGAYFFIPRMGLMGAALSGLVSSCVQAIGSACVLGFMIYGKRRYA